MLAEKYEFIPGTLCSDVAIVLNVVDIVVACDGTWAASDLKAWGADVGFDEPGALVGSLKGAGDLSVRVCRCNGSGGDTFFDACKRWDDGGTAKVSPLSASDHSELR